MKIVKTANMVKSFFIRICVAAITAGIIYAACTRQETKTPGEIMRRQTDKPQYRSLQ